MSKKLESIRKEIAILRNAESDLEKSIHAKQVIPQLKKLIGSTFAYRNNCSSGSEEWDVFRKLLAVSPDGRTVLLRECQIRLDYGTPEISIQWHYVGYKPMGEVGGSGFAPCPKPEYEAAYRATLRQIANPGLAIKKLGAR